MKKLLILLSSFVLFACDDNKPQSRESDKVVKQPFSLSEKPLTETNEKETIKQPFSHPLTDESKAKSNN